jgi:hypothetical protein
MLGLRSHLTVAATVHPAADILLQAHPAADTGLRHPPAAVIAMVACLLPAAAVTGMVATALPAVAIGPQAALPAAGTNRRNPPFGGLLKHLES